MTTNKVGKILKVRT